MVTQNSASKIQCVSFISLGLAINIGVCQILKTKPSTSPNSPSKRLRYILSSLWGENRKKCLVFVKLVNCVGRRIHKIPNDSGIEKMEEMDRILIWGMGAEKVLTDDTEVIFLVPVQYAEQSHYQSSRQLLSSQQGCGANNKLFH